MKSQPNPRIFRADTPDAALFITLLGTMILALSFAPFYWAVYNYKLAQNSAAFIRQQRESSERFLTPKEIEEKAARLKFVESAQGRYRLEMCLSGAGGLILCGIAALLFSSAWRQRKRKQNLYADLNWQAMIPPTKLIVIKYKKLYAVLSVLLILFFGGMLALITFQNFTSAFIAFENAVLRSLIFGGLAVFTLSILLYLMLRAGRKSIRLFDAEGITRGDGKRFAWHQFQGVIPRTHFNYRRQRRYVWRVELAFAGGEEGWLIPNRIKNWQEVFDFVTRLPQAQLKAER